MQEAESLMGYPFWSGVYVEMDPDAFSNAVQRLFQARLYRLVMLAESADLSQLQQLSKYLGGKHQALAWFTIYPGWLRLLGFDLTTGRYPPLLPFSEIVASLGVRALDCGFIEEDKSWWFCYYKNGRPVDWYELPSRRVPLDLSQAAHYAGRPVPDRTAFVDLGKPGSFGDVRMLPSFGPYVPLDEITARLTPQSAIRFMRDNLFLPHIGEWNLSDFHDMFQGWPDLTVYAPYIEQGFSAAAFLDPDCQ